MSSLACPSCGASLEGGIEVCPSCSKPLLESPHMTAVTWTTPETSEIFSGWCPWCGGMGAEHRSAVCTAFRCDCGAYALGAPAYDFDDLVDEAINIFKLSGHPQRNRAHNTRVWLDVFGIEFRSAGKLGGDYWYWVKRVRSA